MRSGFGTVIITAFFAMLILAIPFNAAAGNARSMRVIVIDPAHGGREKGVRITDDTNEKDVTLIVAEFLKRNLEGRGNMKVILTRSSDITVTLADRNRTTVDEHADLFVSIHVNAGFDRNASGYEVYFPGFNVLSGAKNDSGEILKDMVKTRSLNESIRFAQLLQRQMERIFPRKDRGLRDSPLRIIQDLPTPAVVLEVGFVTHVQERKELLDQSKHKAIAEAIGKSIGEYF